MSQSYPKIHQSCPGAPHLCGGSLELHQIYDSPVTPSPSAQFSLPQVSSLMIRPTMFLFAFASQSNAVFFNFGVKSPFENILGQSCLLLYPQKIIWKKNMVGPKSYSFLRLQNLVASNIKFKKYIFLQILITVLSSPATAPLCVSGTKI